MHLIESAMKLFLDIDVLQCGHKQMSVFMMEVTVSVLTSCEGRKRRGHYVFKSAGGISRCCTAQYMWQ